MSDIYYSIDDQVFSQFPGYVRGVVLAHGVSNGDSPPELVAMLRDEEESIRHRLEKEGLVDHPRISSWREAYRSFGAKPSKFRSSIEAMVRRVLNNNDLPTINTLVDIGNVLSLRHLVPTGGHGIDEVTEDIELRPAKGEEEFVAFGSDQVEHPVPGEIIFAEGNTVLTRRWSWRQANHTLTMPTTAAIEYNVDGLPPIPESEVKDICREIMEMIDRFCGGRIHCEILSRQNPRIKLTE